MILFLKDLPTATSKKDKHKKESQWNFNKKGTYTGNYFDEEYSIKEVTLTRVMHTPKCTHNLFSTKRLMADGYTSTGTRNEIIIPILFEIYNSKSKLVKMLN